jgi:glycosyltransferase involved in cell wall biosynthesis
MILFKKIKVNIIFFQMDSLALILLLVFLWQKITKNKKYKIVVDFRSLPMDTKSTKGKFRSIVFYLGVFFCRKLNLKITGITIQLIEYLNFRKNQILGIWPSGADIDEFEECYKKRCWPGGNDPIRIVYIGALTTERNLISAIRGAQIAKNSGVNLTFNIVGDGNQKKDLIELSKKEGYEFVTVDGPFPYQMIPDLLSKNDVGVLPFPNVQKMKVSSAIKMFEYMAAGLPILATKIQAHKNVLSSKEFVFWTNENEGSFARAIEEINNKKEQLPKLGLKAKIFSLNWSWEKSGEKLSKALTRAFK